MDVIPKTENERLQDPIEPFSFRTMDLVLLNLILIVKTIITLVVYCQKKGCSSKFTQLYTYDTENEAANRVSLTFDMY